MVVMMVEIAIAIIVLVESAAALMGKITCKNTE